MTEYSLHSQVKAWYSILGDKIEVKVDEGYIIDILRENILIEIQTRNFSSIKRKLRKLLENKNRIHLIYPIAKIKWLVYVNNTGVIIRKRKSPKKGKIVDLFYELVFLTELVKDKNFSFEILLIEEEEERCSDGRGSWRRRGISIKDRKLLRVFERVLFENRQSYCRFLPFKKNEIFTNRLLSIKLGVSLRLARKISYCLRKMELIKLCCIKKKQYLFKVC
jgi:hypothetical protein